MYQTHASLALLLVFIQYCYGGYTGYGRFWGFIISKEIKLRKNTTLNLVTPSTYNNHFYTCATFTTNKVEPAAVFSL